MILDQEIHKEIVNFFIIYNNIYILIYNLLYLKIKGKEKDAYMKAK